MMPNIDPRTMKNLMAKMGMKTAEIDASLVTIETQDSKILINNPQVTRIEMQGVTSFQITGEVTEVQKETSVEITEDDINMVAEKTGISDREKIRKALQDSNGDIAQAIILLQ
ncbi:MAG: nascent polypeptide-associated complex protein [Candidatus Micrarchaeia archaeon]